MTKFEWSFWSWTISKIFLIKTAKIHNRLNSFVSLNRKINPFFSTKKIWWRRFRCFFSIIQWFWYKTVFIYIDLKIVDGNYRSFLLNNNKKYINGENIKFFLLFIVKSEFVMTRRNNASKIICNLFGLYRMFKKNDECSLKRGQNVNLIYLLML